LAALTRQIGAGASCQREKMMRPRHRRISVVGEARYVGSARGEPRRPSSRRINGVIDL
jgi:hypothetical protein